MTVSNLVPIRGKIIKKVPQKYHKDYYRILETDGVSIDDFAMIGPDAITWNQKQNQARGVSIDITHLKSIKNSMEQGWGDIPPLVVEKDVISDVFEVISGHHRHRSSVELKIDKVPTFTVSFKDRADGMCARTELIHAENDHKPAKAHGEDAAINYLKEYKNRGVFDLSADMTDGERDKEIRKRANKLLKGHYGGYSSNTRGAWVTRFMNGYCPPMMETWTADRAKKWFTTNNHLERLNCWDSAKNRYDSVLQTHTVGWQLPGELTKELITQWDAGEKENLPKTILSQRKKNLYIRLGLYVGREAKTWEKLQEHRNAALETLKNMNLNDWWLPWFVVNEVKFIYQCARGVHTEPHKPIIYKWSKDKKQYELV